MTAPAPEDTVENVGNVTATQPPAGPATPVTAFISPTDAAARAEAESTIRDEKTKRKAAWVRAGIYIAGTHFFAFFVMLLFFLGDHSH